MILARYSEASSKRVLFIGNSYCYVNDLPTVLKKIALSKGDTIITDGNMLGGYTLAMHASNATTIAKIQQGNWDYVVIQAQSQEPSFDPSQVQTDTYPFAQQLDSLVRTFNPCAETLFFMTWGRKNGDASNCPVYPPVCTYAGMQQRLRESYLEMAQLNHATVVPVGVSWKNCRALYPTLDLYQADESHPSEAGTYLAACTFYSSIFHRSALNADTVFTSMNASTASNLQTLCFQTVMDSLENWQQFGDMPFANFSSMVSGLSATFTDLSERNLTWFWDFGDGTTSTQASPVKNYTTAGNYNVSLTVADSCQSDIKTSLLNIGVPSGLSNTSKLLPSVVCNNRTLAIQQGKGFTLEIRTLSGTLIQQSQVDTQNFSIILREVPTGTYIYRLEKKQENALSGKWLIKY